MMKKHGNFTEFIYLEWTESPLGSSSSICSKKSHGGTTLGGGPTVHGNHPPQNKKIGVSIVRGQMCAAAFKYF